MPTYEYKCPNGHAFEKYYPRMNDRRHVPCPICGKSAERMISGGGGLVFRGSGFYITDYKRAGEQTEKTEKKESDAQPAQSKSTQAKAAESKAAESKAAESKAPESSKKKDSRDK